MDLERGLDDTTTEAENQVESCFLVNSVILKSASFFQLFAGEDEIIEVKHTANSRAVFANGAIKAAEFLIIQGVGLYDMNDVLR